MNPNQSFKLTDAQKKILQTQTFSDKTPGSVLKDFKTLLKFIKENEVQLSAKKKSLQAKSLAELNKKMTKSLEINLKRPVQKSYPHIEALYILFRASGIGMVQSVGKKELLVVNDEILQSWNKLNPTEQYFALIRAWWCRGSEEILREDVNPYPAFSYRALKFYFEISSKGVSAKHGTEVERYIKYTVGIQYIGMMELFGMITTTSLPTLENGGWQIGTISRTSFGDALANILAESTSLSVALDMYEVYSVEQRTELMDNFRTQIAPLFPKLKKELALPVFSFQEEVHVFKVSIGRSWRRIAIPGTYSFDSLALIILDAFDFDYDHLYQFITTDYFGFEVVIDHEYVAKESYNRATDKTLIGDLALPPGKTITFRYDFGDEWHFGVFTEKVEENSKVKKATILESRGEAPSQYDFDDEDY